MDDEEDAERRGRSSDRVDGDRASNALDALIEPQRAETAQHRERHRPHEQRRAASHRRDGEARRSQ